MHGLVVVQPAHHVFDVRRHFSVVTHAARAKHHAFLIASDGSPAAAGQNFGEAFGAVNADLILPPPIIDFRHVWSAGSALNNSTNAVGELNETGNIVGR